MCRQLQSLHHRVPAKRQRFVAERKVGAAVAAAAPQALQRREAACTQSHACSLDNSQLYVRESSILMLQRGVMAACGSKAIWATRTCRALRPFGPAIRRGSTRTNAVAEVASPALPAVAPAFKANLDFKFVKDNLQLVADNCKLRNTYADPARVVQLYDEFARLKQECDSLRASRNENSAAMKVRLDAIIVIMLLHANVVCAPAAGLRGWSAGCVHCAARAARRRCMERSC